MKEIINSLVVNRNLPEKDMKMLLTCDSSADAYLYEQAQKVRQQYYGNDIYIRGLIEMSNYCKNNCYYCGIRAGNQEVSRYRLSAEEILSCCGQGYQLGFRTFVLQGGEDMYYTDAIMVDIISAIRSKYPDCAITLSLGERSYETYKAYFDAGADRYLLRHETADFYHYSQLHPDTLSAENRQRCLYDLKRIGYQVGTGFMVGSPYQTPEHLVKDLNFIARLQPQMVGIGPFIPHHQTPFADFPQGSVALTLRLIAILRLMLPAVLLPATTALGTLDPQGREKGILAGANVIMPNLSPVSVRKKYQIYDHKICTGEEAAECRFCLQKRIESIGYQIVVDRGDAKQYTKNQM
ncbi:MAG: [FeFe] hydrogenase H-cluster radical SAM maturase HydE [Bacteroidales bacterium]|nr:[FeFe] hydrogenase H-cluster radical SAM maturase HydE [Bacteroidales bacterium]